MRKVVVFGLGRFGMSVAEHLYAQGAEVLAIDRSLPLVEEIEDKVSVAVACDATVQANLEAYAVGGMEIAIVAVGSDFEASILITMLCRELGVPQIIAKALNPRQKQVLLALGADRVVMPEEEMGARVAEHLLKDSIVDFIELPDGFGLRRIPVPPTWDGKSLAELELLKTEQLNLIQVVRQTEGPVAGKTRSIPLPHGETILRLHDLVDVIGPVKVLDRLT
jgi:trk system potassium uptake protein TrkA